MDLSHRAGLPDLNGNCRWYRITVKCRDNHLMSVRCNPEDLKTIANAAFPDESKKQCLLEKSLRITECFD